jgi:hypothetical protein
MSSRVRRAIIVSALLTGITGVLFRMQMDLQAEKWL